MLHARFQKVLVALPLFLSPLPATANSTSALPSLDSINKALKSAPLDPILNYWAALSYETTSVIGTDRREMARVGYAMAVKSDPSFWPAHVQLGLMAMEDRDARTAQLHLLAAALLQPDEPTIFYTLARAAFCTGDLHVAMSAWNRATALRAPKSTQDYVTGAAVLARAGQMDKARVYLDQLKVTHAPIPVMINLAGATGGNEAIVEPQVPLRKEGNGNAAKMGMVDVIILRRDEGSLKLSGINLLDSLNLQFGTTLINSSWKSSRDRIEGGMTSSTLDIGRDLTVTIPSVTYSLNVANSQGGQSTVQAQQALLIYDGQTSKIHIGSTLTFATDGDLESAVATKEDGLNLEIGAKFSDDGAVKLDINASLEDFVPGGGPGSFRQSVQTEKTTTSVTASLRFGETILIASGEQSLNSRSYDRTPIFSSLPLLGNLFNSKIRTTADSSVLILLTLRPRSSHELPHDSEAERLQFDNLRNRLLDQLDTDNASPSPNRFTPEHKAMSFRVDNPARLHDADYLKRAGLSDIGNQYQSRLAGAH